MTFTHYLLKYSCYFFLVGFQRIPGKSPSSIFLNANLAACEPWTQIWRGKNAGAQGIRRYSCLPVFLPSYSSAMTSVGRGHVTWRPDSIPARWEPQNGNCYRCVTQFCGDVLINSWVRETNAKCLTFVGENVSKSGGKEIEYTYPLLY